MKSIATSVDVCLFRERDQGNFWGRPWHEDKTQKIYFRLEFTCGLKDIPLQHTIYVRTSIERSSSPMMIPYISWPHKMNEIALLQLYMPMICDLE